MNSIILLIIGILQITLLNIVLSCDNIGVIALATKKLPEKFAKKASLIGISFALLLRIVFASCITFIMKIQWLPIKLIGGILLVKITWDLIKPSSENETCNINTEIKFWSAIVSIIIADASMSLDNVLAIAAAADGKIILIVFGILLNIPLLFFGSQFIANLMNKHTIVIYIGGSILAHTAFKMILEDNLISNFLPHLAIILIPWFMACITLIYGFIIIKTSYKTTI